MALVGEDIKRLLLWDLPRVAFPLLVAAYLFQRAMNDGLDLTVYLAGAKEFIAGGDLYADGLPGTPFGGMAFTYPPFAAAVFAPLALLPTKAALALQTTINIICACIVGWHIAHYLHRKGVLNPANRGRWWINGAFVTGLVLLAGPWRNSLDLGQINPMLMMLIVVDLLGSSKRYPHGFLPRGLLTGLAAGIKLTPLVFMLYFVVRRDFRSAARMAAAFGSTVVLMAVLTPALSAQFWLASLGDTNRVGVLSRFENLSLRGLIARLELAPAVGTAVWIGASLAVIALGALTIHRSRHSPDQWGPVAATALVMLLISPVSWAHHWVWVVLLVPALLGKFPGPAAGGFRWQTFARSPAHVFCVLVVVCFALTPLEAARLAGSPNPYASITPVSEMLVQSGLFAAVLVLAWLATAPRPRMPRPGASVLGGGQETMR